MSNYITTSPNYEVLRYSRKRVEQKTHDAHTAGKKIKLIITPHDLIDSTKLPELGNFRFEDYQFEIVDIVVFVNGTERKAIKGEID